MSNRNPLPLFVYGSATCEDTALVTARLRALDIPFALHQREEDSNVEAILEKYNHGNRVTPTLVLGNEEIIFAEPTLEKLQERLTEAGYIFTAPRATEIRGALKNQRAPNFTLPATRGDAFTLYNLRRHKRAVLFFVDDSNDRASQGYARQLTQRPDAFEDFNALPVPLVRADLETTQAWAHEFARGHMALADPNGSVKEKYAALFGIDVSDALLVILDSYYAPRAISNARDAGGLITPDEIQSWLRLLDTECDE